MGLIFNIKEKKTLKGKYTVPTIKICVDCGSTLVVLKNKKIICKNCMSERKIKKIN
ncbi:MAG TPA: hypothetical protein VFG25_05825 [Nitrosopumilaceae archaeon]|nr:hypothetical protein [Nitrosopumilaceae archaeon]